VLNPFSLPLHPAINHFPLAMLSVAWACVLMRYATGNITWDGRIRLFEVVGVASLPFTVAAAFIDTRGIGFLLDPRVDAPLIWHMTSGLLAAIVFSLHYFWRRTKNPTELTGRNAIQDVALMTFGMIALLGAGFLGAEVVYGG
jgi:uncharacterized membrane protein